MVMACKDPSLAERALRSIPIGRENCEVRRLNLASLSDVRRFCDEWRSERRPLDVLACNAGIQVSNGGKASPRFTEDDFEVTVGTNHLGHFALIQVKI